MVNRYSSPGSFRYGFQNQEKDNEIKGEGNAIAFDYRIHDPRLGRFLSIDPLSKGYPWNSPYAFAENKVIQYVELEGLETGIANFMYPSTYQGNNKVDLRDPEYRKAWGNATALIVITGVDLYLTRGWLTRLYLGSQVAEAFEHNRAKTPKGRDAQDQRSKGALADAAIAFGGGIVLKSSAEILFKSGRVLYNFGAKALGEMGEEALARQFGTIKPSGKGSSMSTSLGSRRPDGIPEEATMSNTKNLFESKVGFQEYKADIVNQVAKDAELLAQGRVDEISWVFYRSPTTGKVGASGELLQQLQKVGITTKIAGDIPKDIVNKAILNYNATPKK